MKERAKAIGRSAAAILIVVFAVLTVTVLVDYLYDLRLVLAAVGGAFLYRPVHVLLSKIKALQ